MKGMRKKHLVIEEKISNSTAKKTNYVQEKKLGYLKMNKKSVIEKIIN